MGISLDVALDLFDQAKRIRRTVKVSRLRSFGLALYLSGDFIVLAMIILFALFHIIRFSTFSFLCSRLAESWTPATARDQTALNWLMVSYGFRSGASVLAFVHLISSLRVNPQVGPMMHALGKMMSDVAKFLIWFSHILVGFIIGFKMLYLKYAQSREMFLQLEPRRNSTHDESGLRYVK